MPSWVPTIVLQVPKIILTCIRGTMNFYSFYNSEGYLTAKLEIGEDLLYFIMLWGQIEKHRRPPMSFSFLRDRPTFCLLSFLPIPREMELGTYLGDCFVTIINARSILFYSCKFTIVCTLLKLRISKHKFDLKFIQFSMLVIFLSLIKSCQC